MSSVSITQQPEILPHLRRESIRKIVEQGKRSDGRGRFDVRNIRLHVGAIKTADGSAIVALGNTKVVAGVKIGVGAPFPDTPDEGALIVNLETPPLAAPTIEPGPPDENAIEIARVVDRTIRHSNFIDLKSLCIVPGKYVYMLWVDIYVLNHDGNLVDAACMAAVAALASTTLPRVEIEQEQVKIIREDRTPLKVNLEQLPLTTTFVKIGNALLVDPTLEEENICDSRITIGLAGNKVVAIQKTQGTFTMEDIKTIIGKAYEIYAKLKDAILNAIQNPNRELKV